MPIRIGFLRATVYVVMLLNVSCGGSSGDSEAPTSPRDTIIKDAHNRYFEATIPRQFMPKDALGDQPVGIHGHMNHYELVTVGPYNAEGKYWPIEARGD